MQNPESIEYTYLMFDGLYYKIGKSLNPKKRLKEMATANPNCRLLCYGDCFSESAMHRIFATFRHKGEWFNLRHKEAELAKRMILNQMVKGDLLRVAQLKEQSNAIKRKKQKDYQEKSYAMPFGKYKDCVISKMTSFEELKYLIWVQSWRNIESKYPKLAQSVNNHLESCAGMYKELLTFNGKPSQGIYKDKYRKS